MKKYFPAQDQAYTYLQTNRSDDLGSLWSTMGIDLQSNLGTMRVAPRLLTNTAGASNQGCPVAFKYFDTKIWAICGTRMFSNAGLPNNTFTEDASTGAQTDYSADLSDMDVYDPTGANAQLCATTQDALYAKVLDFSGTGAWTSISTTSFNQSVFHPVQSFKKFNRVYWAASGININSWDGTTVASSAAGDDYSLLLEQEDQISCMRASSQFMWLGINGFVNRAIRGRVYQWDGISAAPTSVYNLDEATGVLAMIVQDDVPHIFDTNGVFSKFNGYGFTELGRLPIQDTLLVNAQTLLANRFIHPNGIQATKNGTFLFNINNLQGNNAGGIYENLPSGIWEWSPDFGFTHKYSYTYTPVATSTITDFGQNRISRVGALANMNVYSTDSGRNGTLLAGATVYTNASSTTNAIFLDDSNNTVRKKGYAVTTWFQSSEIQDKWERLWAVFRRLLTSDDSISCKYRINEEDPTYADITWVNTTSFTTTTDPSAYGPTATGFDGTTGGEVEVIQGTGSGSCAHITAIVNNGGTYTVTLDTAITGVTTGTAKIRLQKWIKIFPSDGGTDITLANQVGGYAQMAIGASNVRIQLKICMTFTGNGEFYKGVLFSNEDIKVTA